MSLHLVSLCFPTLQIAELQKNSRKFNRHVWGRGWMEGLVHDIHTYICILWIGFEIYTPYKKQTYTDTERQALDIFCAYFHLLHGNVYKMEQCKKLRGRERGEREKREREKEKESQRERERERPKHQMLLNKRLIDNHKMNEFCSNKIINDFE